MTDAESWLKRFHDDRPGCTPRAFAAPRTSEGRSSYDVLADEVRPGETVLDLACGDGFLLAQVLARGARAIGVDMSAGELALAREQAPGATLYEARAQELPLADDSVDLVLSHMALMLMQPLEEVLAEVGRVLRPAGRFAFVVGGGGGRGGWAAFVEHLREVPFPRGVRLGDPRARDPEALAELVRAHVGPVGVEPLELAFEADAEGLWAFFEESYDLPMMGPESAALLRQRIGEALPDHPVSCGLTLWLARGST